MKKLLRELPPWTRYSASPPKKDAFRVDLRLIAAGFLFFLLFLWSVAATELWFRETNAHQDTQSNLLIFQQEWEQSKKDLEGVKKRNAELESSLREVQSELERARQSRLEAEERVKELESRYESLREKFLKFFISRKNKVEQPAGQISVPVLPLPQIQPAAVSDGLNLPAPRVPSAKLDVRNPSLKGSILKINHVYQFVIVDLGKKQGVREGEDLYVVRGETVLPGKLKVERLYDTLAACTILLDTPSESLQTGDTVIRQ